MNSNLLAFGALSIVACVLRADPADEVIVAASKLATAANYTWSEQINRNGHPLEISGQTSDNGYSLTTFKGYSAAVSPSHGTDSSGGTNAVFLGDNKYVVESATGWVSPSTDTSSVRDEAGTSTRGTRNGARGGGGGGMRSPRRGGMGGGGMGAGQRGRNSGSNQNETDPVNPPLPLGLNLPHEELSILAANYSDIHVEDGVYVGKLTSSGADLLLAPPGSSQRAPEGAAGTFRIWINDGVVKKYELTLTANTAPGARGGGHFSETVTVEVSNVGSTRFVVPDAAKKRLGA